MFGQLLESRAVRTRRSGGAALSVAMHTAIIGVATVLTAHGVPTTRRVDAPIPVHFTRPVPTPVEPTSAAPVVPRGFVPPTRTIIAVPTIPPVGLPPIEASSGVSLDSALFVSGGTSTRGNPAGVLDIGGNDTPTGGAWTGSELLMRIVTSAKPRYPESLRQAGLGGRVLIRFIVDTAGKIDMSSVQVLESANDGFSRSVRDVLPQFRFKPSELNGKRVRSLAEMPFEFQVAR